MKRAIFFENAYGVIPELSELRKKAPEGVQIERCVLCEGETLREDLFAAIIDYNKIDEMRMKICTCIDCNASNWKMGIINNLLPYVDIVFDDNDIDRWIFRWKAYTDRKIYFYWDNEILKGQTLMYDPYDDEVWDVTVPYFCRDYELKYVEI